MDHDQRSGEDSSDVLSAYDRFRAADLARQARVRAKTGMGDNEIRLVRLLLAAQHDGRDVKPSAIARFLGISSASTTALLDRLERNGTLQRVNNPVDRRSILITATPAAASTLSSTIEYERRVADLATDLRSDARDAVVDFLEALADAADEMDSVS